MSNYLLYLRLELGREFLELNFNFRDDLVLNLCFLLFYILYVLLAQLACVLQVSLQDIHLVPLEIHVVSL